MLVSSIDASARGTTDMEAQQQNTTTYIAFGDGSSGRTGTYYGLVLIPETAVDDVQAAINRVKTRYGGTANAPLHCRELFNEIARKNSLWLHLAPGAAIDLCGELFREVSAFDPVYLLGIMPLSHYPRRFRLRGKYGPPDITHEIDDKWRSLWVFQLVAGMLDPVQLEPPSDPTLIPSKKNKPWWRMHVQLISPGYRVRQVFLDREDTTVTWFSKKFKWITVARDMVVHGTLGPSHLPVHIEVTAKHPLLDLADLFVWSVARATSGSPVEFANFQAEVHAVVFGPRGDELIVGGPTADVSA